MRIKFRTEKEQFEAIDKFLEELQTLSDNHGVYVDGFYVTEDLRDIVNQTWPDDGPCLVLQED